MSASADTSRAGPAAAGPSHNQALGPISRLWHAVVLVCAFSVRCSCRIEPRTSRAPAGRDGATGAGGSSYGEAGSGAGGSTVPPLPGCIDFSQLQTEPPISFKDDLMPIFGLSCIASACHDMNARKAGLVLGD